MNPEDFQNVIARYSKDLRLHTQHEKKLFAWVDEQLQIYSVLQTIANSANAYKTESDKQLWHRLRTTALRLHEWLARTNYYPRDVDTDSIEFTRVFRYGRQIQFLAEGKRPYWKDTVSVPELPILHVMLKPHVYNDILRVFIFRFDDFMMDIKTGRNPLEPLEYNGTSYFDIEPNHLFWAGKAITPEFFYERCIQLLFKPSFYYKET